MLSDEDWRDLLSLLTSIQARFYYPSNIPGCETANPPFGMDVESCSGVEADASWINVEELRFKTEPTAVSAPPRSTRPKYVLGGYLQHHSIDFSDVES